MEKKYSKQNHKFSKEKITLKASSQNKSNSEQLYYSICRIYNGKSKIIGTGFFMQIFLEFKTYYFLVTCSKIISEEDLENNETIIIYFVSNEKEEKRAIKSGERNHFYFLPPFDITLIEILDSDNISKDRFLFPDLRYKNSFSFYLKKSCYIAGFEKNNNKFVSSFEINDMVFYEFNHNINKGAESAGSIICSKDNFQVIGINKEFNNNSNGVFIGKILDHLENIRKGIYIRYDISLYTGTVNYGLRHGKGAGFYNDGGIYEGEWVNDSREGMGIMYYSNGDIYIGDWKNDRREGNGIFYYGEGGIYNGEFKNNIIEGNGFYIGNINLLDDGTLQIDNLDE